MVLTWVYGQKLYGLYTSKIIDLWYRASAMGSAYPYKWKVEGSTPGASSFFFFNISVFFKLYSTKAYAFFSFHPEHHLFLSRKRHLRNQLPKHSVCLFFDDIALTFKLIKMWKCGVEALTKNSAWKKIYESEETRSDSFNDGQCRN